ncbi:glycosyltransferase, partial [Xylophilus sp. ASV27]|uniref:glycosyltransferase n=1 Tax=Xylophilus sp. ASV27 TaxID=2795129 RepID=UPI0018ED4C5F
MKICLNMIVRDEAAVIERCLASVRPYIDRWVIVDTGSVDDTPRRIEAALAGLPGQLHHRPWRNFGHNRTEALNLAREQADYLLFIDADETLGAVPGAAWPGLDGPAYSLEARYGSLSYDRCSLVSTALPWRWEGVLHEYLNAGQPVAQPRVPGFWIDVTPEGARSRDP